MHQRFGISDSLRSEFTDALNAFVARLEFYLLLFKSFDIDFSRFIEQKESIILFGANPNEAVSKNRMRDVIDRIEEALCELDKRMRGISVGPAMCNVLFQRAQKLEEQVNQNKVRAMIRAHFDAGLTENPIERLQAILECFERIEEEECRYRIRRTLSLSTAVQSPQYGRDHSKRQRDRELRVRMKGEARNDDSKISRRSKAG